MPILTPELIKSAEQMESGWTKMKLVDFKSIVKEGHTNEFLTFEGLEGPGNADDNVGRRVTHMIFGKSLATGSIVPDVVDNMLKLIAALLNKPMHEVKAMTGEINFAKFTDRVVWGEIVDDVQNGKTFKKIAKWAPEDVDPR